MLGGGHEYKEIECLTRGGVVKQRDVTTERKSREMEGGGLTDPQAKPLPCQLPQPVSCHLWTHILHAIISCTHYVV